MRPQNPPQINRSREKPLNVLWLRPLWSSGATLDPGGSCDFCRVPGPGCLVGGSGDEEVSHTVYSRNRPGPEPNLQHSMGFDAVCRETILPLASGMCTRNTSLTRVFFLPMSVSPLRSSMSAFLSFRMPAQSMLPEDENPVYSQPP